MGLLDSKQLNQPLNLSGSFTGSFQGTASYALTASYAANANIETGSFVLTSSYNADSASFDTRINSITFDTSSLATTASLIFPTTEVVYGTGTGITSSNILRVSSSQVLVSASLRAIDKTSDSSGYYGFNVLQNSNNTEIQLRRANNATSYASSIWTSRIWTDGVSLNLQAGNSQALNIVVGVSQLLSFNNSSGTVYARFGTGGNLMIGSTTDGGDKLQVNGVINATRTKIPFHTMTDQIFIAAANGTSWNTVYNGTGKNMLINGDLRFANTTGNGAVYWFRANYGGTSTWNAKDLIRLNTDTEFIGAASGVNSSAMIHIDPKYNYTGGTNDVYGIRYNPTVSSSVGVTHYAFDASSGKIRLSDLSGSTSRVLIADDSGSVIPWISTGSFDTVSGSFFKQGGNSFGARAIVGTLDDQDLLLIRSGSNKLFFNAANMYFYGNSIYTQSPLEFNNWGSNNWDIKTNAGTMIRFQGNIVNVLDQRLQVGARGIIVTATGANYALQTVTGNNVLGTTSGNTIIGTTTDTGHRFQVNGNSYMAGNLTATSHGMFGNFSFGVGYSGNTQFKMVVGAYFAWSTTTSIDGVDDLRVSKTLGRTLGISGSLNVSNALTGITYTPTSSTDPTYPTSSIVSDDSFLYRRNSSGDWTKIAWGAF